MRERTRQEQQAKENPEQTKAPVSSNSHQNIGAGKPIPMGGARNNSSLKLSQLDYVSPKKFNSARKKQPVNLQEVRQLLHNTKKDNN